MLWFKACRKCGGDLYLREIPEDRELVCMQCGFIASPAAVRRFSREQQQSENEVVSKAA